MASELFNDLKKYESELRRQTNVRGATALLGLKLESTKANADVMVIDHVEKPSPNSVWTEDAVPVGSPPIRK